VALRLADAESASAAAGGGERGKPWPWIGAGAAAVLVLGIGFAIWSADDPTPPAAATTTAAAEQAPPVLPAGDPPPAVSPVPAEVVPAADLMVPPAIPAASAPLAGAPTPADDPALARRRDQVARGRAALGRGDHRAALAAAREASQGSQGDVEVSRLLADLHRAGTAAAAAAVLAARTGGAPELAADWFQRAEAKRQEGVRLGAGTPAGPAALWDSVPLYEQALANARTEQARRSREQQDEVARLERERREAEARQVRQTPPPTPRPAAPVSTPAAAARPAADATAGVNEAIQRYRRGFEALDAAAVQAVMPSVNAGQLAGSFNGYTSAQVSIGGCDVQVSGATATAVCQRDQTIQPKAGRQMRSNQRIRFRLSRTGDGWRIDGIDPL
jgi:hypothetical protein